MRTSAELREGFLAFFESKGHLRLPSASLVPETYDPSVLLTTAGMQPLKPYILGLAEPPSQLLTTVQKCFRATDIDEVGLTARHLTFFEMLGNFSLGDYFKDGAVDLAWEFVTEHMRLAPEVLWATVFAGDPEFGLERDEVAVAAWDRIGIPAERIVDLPRSENFWQAGPTGPCGPCSELYVDRGPEHGCDRPNCAPGCECDRFLEIWNLVFMEFDLRADGTLTPLPSQTIDTGMGVERGAAVLQGVHSVYETDGFQEIMEWVAGETGTRYGESELATKCHRVLADHGRAMTFLVADGVTPSNEGRGYVLRRVIRRAVLHGRDLGLESFLPRLSGVVVGQMGSVYPELREKETIIGELLAAEEERFSRTLALGERYFEEAAADSAISGEEAFKLHDTYGYPIELTRERARERGLGVDEAEFERLMAEQRERSRAAAAFDVEIKVAGSRPTEFVGYEQTEVLTALMAVEELEDGVFQAKLFESPFYPEGGGQVSDVGWIEKLDGSARAELVKATRVGDDQALTFRGEGFRAGDRVKAVVPWRIRFPTMANHTATHLLHKALQEVLGDHVRQAGSAVRPEKLRFDFTHPQGLTGEERQRVEEIVNERVFEALPVRAYLTPIDEARQLGAMMLFGEKYGDVVHGDVVRVVEIPGFSRELCGGTHVRSTAEIGPFVILSEGSIGSGVRRIEAVTSGDAYAYLRAQAEARHELERELARARKEQKAPKREVETVVSAEREQEVNGVRVYVAELANADAEELLEVSDREKQKRSPAAVVLGSREDGRVHLVANFDEAVADRGLSAVEVVKAAAALVGGGGGGRPTMARAGGGDPERLADALAHAEQAIVQALT